MRKYWMLVIGLVAVGIAGIAVPAWAGSEESSPDVDRAAEPAPPRGALALPGPSPEMRAQLDEGLQCMEEQGFGAPDPEGDERGIFIPREEADSEAFREAAEECELPPPPTDAEIRAIGCAEDRAREEG
jgi:hypothetical protein